MYQILICRDRDPAKLSDWPSYGEALAAAQRKWDSMNACEKDACSGLGGTFELLCNGKPIAVWRGGCEVPSFYSYVDEETGNHMTYEAAVGLLEHRYTRWQYQCDLTERYGSFTMPGLDLVFTAGDILQSHPELFEQSYDEELLGMMEEIGNGATHRGIRLAKESWLDGREE